jgi:hypothetical protein
MLRVKQTQCTRIRMRGRRWGSTRSIAENEVKLFARELSDIVGQHVDHR